MLFDLLKYGFFNGIYIALVSVGFALIFNILRTIDFSLTDRMTFSGYVFIISEKYIKGLISSHLQLPFVEIISILVGCLLSILSCIILTLIIEKYIFTPIKEKGTSILIITSFGISVIMQSLMSIIFTNSTIVSSIQEYSIPGIGLYPREILVLSFAVTIMIVLNLIIKKTLFGKSINALVFNYELAIFHKIPVKKISSLVFGISAFIIAISGISLSVGFGIYPNIGNKYMIYSFCACLIGGLKNLYGTVIASILLGVFLQFGDCFTSPIVSESLTLIILLVLLYIKPEGLFFEKIRVI
ncbi:MAG: branched-chain amino acid ABC transporter permease [Bacteroidetes bacterium]|nr:MAG: branched-chain amino acid ABC transporter permease [Bacteroidota bacterium]